MRCSSDMQSPRLSVAQRGCSESSAPSIVAAAGRNGLGIRSVTWHSSVPPEKETILRRRDVRSPPMPTIEEPQPSAEDRHKRWLEQEVVRLTDVSQDLEEQLLEAQSAAMDMASRIEQLEELVKVVGNGAAAALDAQCNYLQAEITQQDQSLAEKQDSLAMLQEQHAQAMQRKETQVRGLQRKLFDATTQLRAQEQAMQAREERFAKLRTVYTDNQKLRGRVAKLTEEAEAREQELQELRELVDLEIDRAAASMAAEEETCEMFEDLAGELVGFASLARATRRLLRRANMRHPAKELPSPLWEAGFVECMQLLNRLCIISNSSSSSSRPATDEDSSSCKTWTPLTSGGGTDSICYSPLSIEGSSAAYAATFLSSSSAGGTSSISCSPRAPAATATTVTGSTAVFRTVYKAGQGGTPAPTAAATATAGATQAGAGSAAVRKQPSAPAAAAAAVPAKITAARLPAEDSRDSSVISDSPAAGPAAATSSYTQVRQQQQQPSLSLQWQQQQQLLTTDSRQPPLSARASPAAPAAREPARPAGTRPPPDAQASSAATPAQQCRTRQGPPSGADSKQQEARLNPCSSADASAADTAAAAAAAAVAAASATAASYAAAGEVEEQLGNTSNREGCTYADGDTAAAAAATVTGADLTAPSCTPRVAAPEPADTAAEAAPTRGAVPVAAAAAAAADAEDPDSGCGQDSCAEAEVEAHDPDSCAYEDAAADLHATESFATAADLMGMDSFMTVAAEFSAATLAGMAAAESARPGAVSTEPLHTDAGNSHSSRQITVTEAAAAAVAAMAAVEQAFTAAAVEGIAAAAAEASFMSQQNSDSAVSSLNSTQAADDEEAAESGAEPDTAGSCSTTVPSSPSSHPISTACAGGAQATLVVPRVSSLIKALESKASAGSQTSPRQPARVWQGKGGSQAGEAMRQWRSPRAAVVARLEGSEV